MKAKTKKTLTLVAVGAVAFFGVRYLLKDKSKDKSNDKSNDNENTSNASGVVDCGCGG